MADAFAVLKQSSQARKRARPDGPSAGKPRQVRRGRSLPSFLSERRAVHRPAWRRSCWDPARSAAQKCQSCCWSCTLCSALSGRAVKYPPVHLWPLPLQQASHRRADSMHQTGTAALLPHRKGCFALLQPHRWTSSHGQTSRSTTAAVPQLLNRWEQSSHQVVLELGITAAHSPLRATPLPG